MDGEDREMLRDIRDSVKETRAEIVGKIDSQAKAFQDHLVVDAAAFATLKVGQENLHREFQEYEARRKGEIEKEDQRRREESEKRLKKVEAHQAQEQAETLAKKAGRWAVAAAAVGSLILWILERIWHK
jgi:hypothetical protein